MIKRGRIVPPVFISYDVSFSEKEEADIFHNTHFGFNIDFRGRERKGNLTSVAAIVIDDVLAAATDARWKANIQALGADGSVLDAESVACARNFDGITRVSHHHHIYSFARSDRIM